MSNNPSVLHLQSDTGFTGGIASYISRLTNSQNSLDNIFVVVGYIDNSHSFFSDFYGSAKLLKMHPKYSLFNFFPYVLRLINFVSTNSISVIHAHALRSFFPALLVSLWCNTRLIYTNHGIRFTQKKSLISRFIFKLLEYIALLFSDAVVCIRPYDYDLLNNLNFSRKKLFYIPTRLNNHNSISSGAKNYSFIGIGSLIDVKQPFRFIDWIDCLVKSGLNVNAVWLGSGDLLDQCVDIVKSKCLPIIFLGQVNSSTLNGYLDRSSVLLLSSDYEVFPLSVLEAYSHGVPVIATNFNGIPDIVIDGHTGFIVSSILTPLDIENISKLLNDSNFYLKLSSNCKSFFANNFMNSDLMALEYSRLYKP